MAGRQHPQRPLTANTTPAPEERQGSDRAALAYMADTDGATKGAVMAWAWSRVALHVGMLTVTRPVASEYAFRW